MTATKWTNVGVVVVLLSGFGVLSMAAQDKPTVESITKLADDATKKSWADLSKAGADVAKKHELKNVMNLFKLRKPADKMDETPSGLGVGPTPGAIMPDGIDLKIRDLTKKPLTAAALAREQEHLIRMAEIVASIAATSVHQCPVDKKLGDKDPAEWKQWSEDMHKNSLELIKTIKGGKPVAIQKQAFILFKTCTQCHGPFRDSNDG